MLTQEQQEQRKQQEHDELVALQERERGHYLALKGLSGAAQARYVAQLRGGDPSGRVALRESAERVHPEWTPEQLEAFAQGRNPSEDGLFV